MRLGILADIHEDLKNLKSALGKMKEENVDQIILLGDVFEMGINIQETTDILANANASGVFGNHDLGFCHEPDT